MLKMMLAYNNGDIVVWTKTSILSREATLGRFSSLPGSSNDGDNRFLLAYIVERYANMQGTIFVRHVKG
jgi:hypothetical protein